MLESLLGHLNSEVEIYSAIFMQHKEGLQHVFHAALNLKYAMNSSSLQMLFCNGA